MNYAAGPQPFPTTESWIPSNQNQQEQPLSITTNQNQQERPLSIANNQNQQERPLSVMSYKRNDVSSKDRIK